MGRERKRHNVFHLAPKVDYLFSLPFGIRYEQVIKKPKGPQVSTTNIPEKFPELNSWTPPTNVPAPPGKVRQFHAFTQHDTKKVSIVNNEEVFPRVSHPTNHSQSKRSRWKSPLSDPQSRTQRVKRDTAPTKNYRGDTTGVTQRPQSSYRAIAMSIGDQLSNQNLNTTAAVGSLGCQKCGKLKMAASASHCCTAETNDQRFSQATTAFIPSPFISNQQASFEFPVSEGQPPKNCNKCGKYRKSAEATSNEPPVTPDVPSTRRLRSEPSFHERTTIAHPFPPLSAVQLSHDARFNSLPSSMQIGRATAMTSYPVDIRFISMEDDVPLVKKSSKSEFNMFRKSSIARSLSRHQSQNRTPKIVEANLPEVPTHPGVHQSAIQTRASSIQQILPEKVNQASLSKLNGDSTNSTQNSPFSFAQTPSIYQEDDFEILSEYNNDKLNKGNQHSTDADEEACVEQTPILNTANVEHTEYSTVEQPLELITEDIVDESNSKLPLMVVEQERPRVTRFHSLRGILPVKMSSLSPRPSLKSLSSLKSLHRSWYRDDMSLEAANSETVVL